MNHIYCTECGAKVEYNFSKPKFCSNCGTGFGTLKKSKSNLQENVEIESYSEDETAIDEVPELYNGLAVETESYGNNVFSFESLVGEEDKSRSAKRRSINMDDFIDGRRN